MLADLTIAKVVGLVAIIGAISTGTYKVAKIENQQETTEGAIIRMEKNISSIQVELKKGNLPMVNRDITEIRESLKKLLARP